MKGSGIVKIILVMSASMILFISGALLQKFYPLGTILKKLYPGYTSPFKDESIKDQHQGKLSIFILAGQANMEGYGDVSEYEPLLNQDRIYVFDDKYKWKTGKEPVRRKVGPSISFASELIKNSPDEVIGIVNVAVGNTNIEQWSKSYSDTSLYQNLMKRTLAASTQGEIKGLLFYQGENDAKGGPKNHYDDWDILFEKFIRNVRHDLECDSLPVVFSQIGRGDFVKWEEVKESQERVNLNHVTMIKSDDLEYQKDSIHFTTSAYMVLGKRFAKEYMDKFRERIKN